MSPDAFTKLLYSHADQVLESSLTNAQYANKVRENAEKVGKLLVSGTGSVNSVVSTWRTSFRPIAEALFGPEGLPENTDEIVQTHAEYRETVFEGVYGSVTRISDDEIMGPMLSLDILALRN